MELSEIMVKETPCEYAVVTAATTIPPFIYYDMYILAFGNTTACKARCAALQVSPK